MPVKKLTSILPERSLTKFIKTTGALKVNDTLARLSQHFGDNMPPTLSDDELKIPDTKIVNEATKLSESLNRRSIYLHSIRCYLFGICIGKYENELNQIDREQFYISCILSKIGLNDDIRDLDENRGKDYEIIGADYAYKWLTSPDINYDKLKCDQVHEAISLHTSVGTVDLMEPQFSLLYSGYALDTIGTRKYNVRTQVIHEIINKYPRNDFINDIKQLFDREARDKPFSAVAGDIGCGLEPLISLNPIDEKQGYPL